MLSQLNNITIDLGVKTTHVYYLSLCESGPRQAYPLLPSFSMISCWA